MNSYFVHGPAHLKKASLPPDATEVEFHEDEDGHNVAGPVDEATATATASVLGYTFVLVDDAENDQASALGDSADDEDGEGAGELTPTSDKDTDGEIGDGVSEDEVPGGDGLDEKSILGTIDGDKPGDTITDEYSDMTNAQLATAAKNLAIPDFKKGRGPEMRAQIRAFLAAQ